jgi:3-oxoacyl-[acyl-carrier protein] reductase
MLGASLISNVIGTRLPGPGALWVSQDLEFLSPVRLGDVLTVSSTVIAKHARDSLLDLETVITNQYGQVVLKGNGRVKVFEVPEVDSKETTAKRLSPVAIVTGGAGGIGAAICQRLALDGFQVVVNFYRNKERAERLVELIESQNGSAQAVRGDVSTVSGAADLVRRAEDFFGSVGILVNNASPRINPKPLMEMDWNDVQKHLDVQVKSALWLTQQCVPKMTERGQGRIINITSLLARGNPVLRWTSYAIAKTALSTLSRQMAVELGPSGITVNCVAPGMTETALIGDISQKQQLIVARQTPLRSLALPEDIAAAVSFLASEGGRFVTGQSINVNGGIEMS